MPIRPEDKKRYPSNWKDKGIKIPNKKAWVDTIVFIYALITGTDIAIVQMLRLTAQVRVLLMVQALARM